MLAFDNKHCERTRTDFSARKWVNYKNKNSNWRSHTKHFKQTFKHYREPLYSIKNSFTNMFANTIITVIFKPS